MSLSNTYETQALKWLFTTDGVTRPSSWFIAAFTAAPTDADSGTEVTGGSYARQSETFTVTGNSATNDNEVLFPVATADWGTVTHVGLYTASSGGTLIAWAALDVSKTVNTNDRLRVYAGDLTFTAD